MSNEFPKMLYKDGDQDGEHVVVVDAQEEKERRADGYRCVGDSVGKKARDA